MSKTGITETDFLVKRPDPDSVTQIFRILIQPGQSPKVPDPDPQHCLLPGGERKGFPKPRQPGIDQMEAGIQQQVRDKHVRALSIAVLLLVMWISTYVNHFRIVKYMSAL